MTILPLYVLKLLIEKYLVLLVRWNKKFDPVFFHKTMNHRLISSFNTTDYVQYYSIIMVDSKFAKADNVSHLIGYQRHVINIMVSFNYLFIYIMIYFQRLRV